MLCVVYIDKNIYYNPSKYQLCLTCQPKDAKMMMPRTRKKTRSINSFAEARNVCNRIFSPDECRVNLNSLRRIILIKIEF